MNYLYIQPKALYYLKLKNYLQYIALIQYKLSSVFKIYPTCFGNQQKANQASKSGFKDTPEDGARLAPKHVG
jgi:hypothetical protein